MKKYERPMLTEEIIPNTDTALSSTGACQWCSGYAPDKGITGGGYGSIDGDTWFCNNDENDRTQSCTPMS